MIIPDPDQCPPEIRGALQMFVDHGIEPGDFTRCVLCNDLAGACARAHPTIAHALVHILAYCNAALPAPCWGSPAKVRQWIDDKREGKRAHLTIANVSDLASDQPKEGARTHGS